MIHRLQWHRGPGDGPYSAPSSLAPYVGQNVTIEVRPHQTALILRHHEIRAALLPNLHQIHVRRPRGIGPEDLAAIASVREVRPEDVVLFLQLGSFPTPLSSPSGGSGPGWKGVAHLRVTEPRRFYESFLRHSEDLPTEQFERICSQLMGGIAAKYPCSLATPTGRNTLCARIEVRLRGVGLRLERLDLGAPSEAASSEEVPPLVTSAGKL